jgi:hypothetical protein
METTSISASPDFLAFWTASSILESTYKQLFGSDEHKLEGFREVAPGIVRRGAKMLSPAGGALQTFYFQWFMVGAAGFEPATSTV